MSTENEDRRAVINRLHEHEEFTPMDDETRAQVVAALAAEHERKINARWHRRLLKWIRR